MSTAQRPGPTAAPSEADVAARDEPTAGEPGPGPWLGSRVSARVRILGWLLFMMTLAMVAVGISVRTILLNQVENDVARSLSQEIEEFTEFATTARDPDDGQPFTEAIDLLSLHLQREYPDDDEVFFGYTDVLVRQERLGPGDLVSDPDVVAAIVTSPEATGSLETVVGELRWAKQVAVPAAGGQSGTFVIGYLIDRDRADVTSTMRVVTAVSVLALLLTGGLAWVVAGQILAPVRLVRRTAAEITTADLSRRIPVVGHDDVAGLSVTFNTMLDRLESAFSTQRQFVDDASHELRTPITIGRGHLELMGPDPVEREETIRLVTDELDRMNRIVDDLLVLAKADRPDFVRRRPVDLADLTRDVGAKVGALGERDWQLESTGEGTVELDPQRITQAMVQLAQNAVQHTEVGDQIRLGSAVRDGTVCLWVADTGPGVPEADVATVFERFSRGSTGGARAHVGGAGLGLSIVRAIADAHAGTVALVSRPGRGATFRIEVPASTREDAPGEGAVRSPAG